MLLWGTRPVNPGLDPRPQGIYYVYPMGLQISRWGNSLAVRLPKGLLDAAGLMEGDEVTIREERGRIVIEREPAVDLEAMIAGITEENRPEENFDWPLAGRELW